jgi:hypothetical protein
MAIKLQPAVAAQQFSSTDLRFRIVFGAYNADFRI